MAQGKGREAQSSRQGVCGRGRGLGRGQVGWRVGWVEETAFAGGKRERRRRWFVRWEVGRWGQWRGAQGRVTETLKEGAGTLCCSQKASERSGGLRDREMVTEPHSRQGDQQEDEEIPSPQSPAKYLGSGHKTLGENLEPSWGAPALWNPPGQHARTRVHEFGVDGLPSSL